MSRPVVRASCRLQLNPFKTEVIWLGTRYHIQQLAVTKPSTVVRDLGVLIDTELTL